MLTLLDGTDEGQVPFVPDDAIGLSCSTAYRKGIVDLVDIADGREDGVEPHPGVFVSRVSTNEWEPDPDVPGTEMHELVKADGVWAGLTRYTNTDGPLTWTPEQREVAVILEGSVRIELAGGGGLDLGTGDLFSLPPGIETTWHISTPFKEMWVLASD